MVRYRKDDGRLGVNVDDVNERAGGWRVNGEI